MRSIREFNNKYDIVHGGGGDVSLKFIFLYFKYRNLQHAHAHRASGQKPNIVYTAHHFDSEAPVYDAL